MSLSMVPGYLSYKTYVPEYLSYKTCTLSTTRNQAPHYLSADWGLDLHDHTMMWRSMKINFLAIPRRRKGSIL